MTVRKPAFVAVDWGTSSFRAWLMAADGHVLAETRGPEGMLHCATAGFAPVLSDHLVKLGATQDLPVLRIVGHKAGLYKSESQQQRGQAELQGTWRVRDQENTGRQQQGHAQQAPGIPGGITVEPTRTLELVAQDAVAGGS